MKRIGFSAAAIAFAALCTAPALALAATTTLFSEAVSGDLGQGAAAPSLSAVLGGNVVEGTTSWIGLSPDIDGFNFTVAPGQVASNFSFSFTNALLVSPEQIGGAVFLYKGTLGSGSLIPISDSPFLIRAQNSPFGDSTPSPLQISTGGPLSAGPYAISIEINGKSPNGGAAPYSLAFDVAAIPEPATYAVMLGGLGLLGLVVRRRKQSAGQ
jgi:hypothetical protein